MCVLLFIRNKLIPPYNYAHRSVKADGGGVESSIHGSTSYKLHPVALTLTYAR
jgi:hypothetical protein